MRVIVTGGGTGGHIYPALAIAQGIMAQNAEHKILYVGTRESMEARLVPNHGFDFAGVSGQGLPRKLSPDMIKVAGKSVKALWETKEILKNFHPDLIVGTGGYVSGPVVLTGAIFGIPTLLHEQNALPGITNRILSHLVRRVLLTFPESEEYFGVKKKLKVVGLPVRPEIGRVSREEGAKHFGLKSGRLTLLVTGGSRGARTLNQAMLTVLKGLERRPEIQVIWATGQATHTETMTALRRQGLDPDFPSWRILEYLADMPEAYACADLCVGRAGAASLAELAIAGKPGILIPYPFAAENHQEYNAQAVVKAGAARMILDKELTGERLQEQINVLLINRAELAKMSTAAFSLAKPQALNDIVKICLDVGWK